MDTSNSTSAMADLASGSRFDGAVKQLDSRMKNDPAQMDDREMRKVSREFESIMVRQLIKNMRKTATFGEDNAIFNTENSTRMYQEIADDHLADHMSASGSFGVSDLIYDFLVDQQKSLATLQDMQDKSEFMSLQDAGGTPPPEAFMPLKRDGVPKPEDFMPLHPGVGSWQGMELDPSGPVFVPLDKQPAIGLDRQERR